MEKKDIFDGTTIKDAIKGTVTELNYDEISLDYIVTDGIDSFELEGEALDIFIIENILALLRAGAIAEKVIEKTRYVGSNTIIAGEILEDWHESKRNGKDITWNIWFSKRMILGK